MSGGSGHFLVYKVGIIRLLHCYEVIVLLTLLSKEILAIDEVFSGDRTVLVGQLLLVQGNATTLHHLAHLTLRGEDGSGSGEELNSGLSELVLANLKLLNTVEHIEECLFVELLKCLLRCFAEEYV